MNKTIFSLDELLVLKILGRRRMTIAQITEACYIDREEAKPIEPNNYIGNVIRRIEKKCAFYKLKWTIKGEGIGRGGRTVWRETV